MTTSVDAILPAAGRIRGHHAAQTDLGIKALLEIEGHTLLEHTLRTVELTGRVARTVVVGPPALADSPAASGATAVLAEGSSVPDNVLRGLQWLAESNGGAHADRVLVVATDLPFLTPEALVQFLDDCPRCADICLPILRREAFEGRFPGSHNEFVRLRDGEWTMGCTFLVNPQTVVASHMHIERVCNARKSQMAMAMLLGPLFIARFVTRRLRVEHIERRCGQILGCQGAAVFDSAPELAFDIDDPEDYEYAAGHLSHRLTAA